MNDLLVDMYKADASATAPMAISGLPRQLPNVCE